MKKYKKNKKIIEKTRPCVEGENKIMYIFVLSKYLRKRYRKRRNKEENVRYTEDQMKRNKNKAEI